MFRSKKVASWFLLLACSVIAVSAQERTLTGRVVAVSDGDTITILDENNVKHKVRIRAIDAPERFQEYGANAKEHLSTIVYDQTVIVTVEGQDEYGREVGKVMVGDLDVGLAMIDAGWAWYFKENEKEWAKEVRKLYSDREHKSRKVRVGLWVADSPVAPPWKYRKSNPSLPYDDLGDPRESNGVAGTPESTPPASSTPSSTPGKEVKVRGYYRKDGTYVRPHTRSAPKRRN